MCAVDYVPCKDIHIVPNAELKPAERDRHKKGEESAQPQGIITNIILVEDVIIAGIWDWK